MKIVKILFGTFLALLAFGFLINLTKEQSTWGGGRWTAAGREHAEMMVAAILISTGVFAVLFAVSLFGSLALFKSAGASRTVSVLELIFAIMLMFIAIFTGLLSLDKVRSVEVLIEGVAFFVVEGAASILLFFLAFKGALLQRRAGTVIKLILAVILVLISLLNLLAMNDVKRMTRYEAFRAQTYAVLIGYALLELGCVIALIVSAFRRRLGIVTPASG